MFNEADILTAFELLCVEQTAMALATVVAIEGSSYRRLGARMLIAADGRQFGMISGGCLEGDVARRCRQVIESGATLLCRYETGDDTDADLGFDERPTSREPGISLGCGGALEILIQPVTADSPATFALVRAAVADHRMSRAATVYRIGGPAPFTPGSVLPLPTAALSLIDYADGFHRIFLTTGWVDVLIETFAPPKHLMILGDGPDVLPLLELARFNGWRTSVAGYRSTPLPCDQRVQLRDHEEASLPIDPSAAVVLMTHDLRRDARLLRHLATTLPKYVGVLGPAHRTRRMLSVAKIDASLFDGRLFAPIGLDLGGDGPQRVALSIIAEIAAVMDGHAVTHLRDKDAGIHDATIMAATMPAYS